LEGKIDEKYPIEMYLTESWGLCDDEKAYRWEARLFKGWYQYTKVKKKIPLIGSVSYRDGADYFAKFFVPKHPLDTLEKATCNLKDYKEIFFVESSRTFEKMAWRQADTNTFLPVELNQTHSSSLATEVNLEFYLSGLKMTTFNLSDLTKIEVIQSVEILSSKEVDGNFYSIFNFGHSTNPGSWGRGHCGAGYESYLGFIKINSQFELEEFEYFQTHSCIKHIDPDLYFFDKENPQTGIQKNDD